MVFSTTYLFFQDVERYFFLLFSPFNVDQINKSLIHPTFYGLQTPNEGINQRNLKIWADGQTKYALAVPKNLRVGVDFRPCIQGNIPRWASVVRATFIIVVCDQNQVS